LNASVRNPEVPQVATAVDPTEAYSESADGPACFNEVPATINQRVDFFA
jgi:hypothetical protein